MGQELNMVGRIHWRKVFSLSSWIVTKIHQIKTPVVISVKSAGKVDRVETNFMGPNTKQ